MAVGVGEGEGVAVAVGLGSGVLLEVGKGVRLGSGVSEGMKRVGCRVGAGKGLRALLGSV